MNASLPSRMLRDERGSSTSPDSLNTTQKPNAHGQACAVRVGLFGDSRAHTQTLIELQRIAQFNAEVFLVGETGVGKELYAKFIHACSPRSAGAFVAINCGAIPDALFENELFGHAAGAYTDANSRSEGLIAEANGGTLFLDEVDGLTRAAQVKLLRLLQEKEYRRLGEAKLRRADIRVISAMNRDPQEAIEQGVLRQDLFYRLNVNLMQITPLRQRHGDISLLTDQFVSKYSKEYGRNDRLLFTPAARQSLALYPWPGNVRQLENLIRSLVCQHSSTSVDAGDLRLTRIQESVESYTDENFGVLLDLPFAAAKQQVVDRFEVDYIQEMLRRTDGNICQAAKLAGKHRRAFFELMRKHGISSAKENSCADENDSSRNAKPR